MWAIVAIIAPAAAQDDSPQARVARLIPLLGSPSYAERRLATDELARLGAAAREALQKEADATDPEIRRRACGLLDKLRGADLWEPSRVTVQCQGESARKVLEQLVRQSGNRVAAGDAHYSLRDVPVTISATGAPFWPVLDDLCRQSGNYVRPPYEHRQPGFVAVEGRFGQFPLAYAGPVRGRVTGARRIFTEELDHEKATSEVSHSFQLMMQFTWEDRFRVVAFQPQVELLEAVTDTGARLTALGIPTREWEAAAESSRQITTALSLRPPPVAARQFDVLRVRWGLLAVGHMATLEVNDLSVRRAFTQDDLRLTVQELDKLADGRYRLILLVSRDLLLPEPRSVAFHENEWDLYDAQDQPLQKAVTSWRFTDEGLRIQATLTSTGEGGEPARLRFSYPRIRSQRGLEVLFRNVPLPTARPE
jgi:hypothetical protein